MPAPEPATIPVSAPVPTSAQALRRQIYDRPNAVSPIEGNGIFCRVGLVTHDHREDAGDMIFTAQYLLVIILISQCIS